MYSSKIPAHLFERPATFGYGWGTEEANSDTEGKPTDFSIEYWLNNTGTADARLDAIFSAARDDEAREEIARIVDEVYTIREKPGPCTWAATRLAEWYRWRAWRERAMREGQVL